MNSNAINKQDIAFNQYCRDTKTPFYGYFSSLPAVSVRYRLRFTLEAVLNVVKL